MSLVHAKVDCCVLGDAGVGKTSITHRFVMDTFQQEIDSTLGATYMSRVLSVGSHSIKFNIWDTAGQDRFRAVAKTYYHDASAAVLVYDITKQETFDSLKWWVKELREHGPENIVLAVAGNKEDLVDFEEVDIDRAKAWAAEVGAGFKKTSAKTASGVESLFRELAGKVDSTLVESPQRGVQVTQAVAPPPRSEKCCK